VSYKGYAILIEKIKKGKSVLMPFLAITMILYIYRNGGDMKSKNRTSYN